MGLKEKRAIEIVKNRDVPEAEQEIKTYLGTSFPITVDWASLETSGESGILYLNGMALKKISGAMLIASHDEFVKKAFAEQIKAVHVSHVASSADKSVSYADGTITLKVNFTDTYEGNFSDRDIYNKLMDSM